MKREDYFNLMDCVSEEDITEMMQYCRSGQFSDREEEIVMTKQNHAESESKRGKGIAAAVAAVLVCANIAGGAYLLNSGRQPEHSAGTSVQSAPIEEVTAAVTTEALSTESVMTEADKPAELPQYVKLMQEYYTNLNGQPCTYDFTGLGQDYNLVYEFPDYTLTLKSVVGCDWVVYYFYDIKPEDTSETGSGYTAWLNNGHENAGDLVMFKDGKINFNSKRQDRTSLNSEQTYEVDGDVMRDYALEDGVWHMVDRIDNCSDKPFFSGENSGMLVSLETVQYLKEGQKVEPFTFEAKEFPLHETVAPEITVDLPADTDKFTQENATESLTKYRKWTNAHPLTRCAETPFGTYYVSDLYTEGIEHGYSVGMPMDSLSINGKPFGKYSRANLNERGGAVMQEEPRGYVSLFDAYPPQ